MKPQPELERYWIHERIGEGAFGEVYRATHKLLDREVAIKFIKSDLAEKARHRFIHEARSVARLNHPHILQVYDFDVTGEEQYFMAMEYLPDGDLESLLVERRREGLKFGLLDVLLIVKSVAVGLHHAHRQGIIHRDIKPSNIFFSKDQRVVVGDFGLAKELDSKATQTIDEGGLAGTPGYLAPEQIQGEPSDHRSDIYALGVIMYQLLAGERPYTGELHAVLIAHLQAPVPDLAKTRPDLPKPAADIIQRAMAKDPDERYQSMKEMIDDINNLAADLTDSDRTLLLANPDDLSASLLSLTNISLLRTRKPSITHRPAWRVVGQIVPLVLILVLIIGALAFGASGWLTNDDAPQAPISDPLANIVPASPTEELVVVAPMIDDVTGIDIGDLIYQQLQNGDTRIILSDTLRVEQLAAPITSADQAQALGMESGAELVIWGQKNAAGWEIRVQGPGRADNTVQDLRMFVLDDADFSTTLVQSVPILADYYTRIMSISTAIRNDQLIDALWLLFSFREWQDTSILDLAQRPADADLLRSVLDIVSGDYISADQHATNLLSTTPDELALLLIRWGANTAASQSSQSIRDAERISDLLDADSEFAPALRTTTYYIFGDAGKVLSSVQPIWESDSATARFAQNQAVEVLIHEGDYAAALAYADRDIIEFLGRVMLIYAIQGDQASIAANLPDYLDQRADRFQTEAQLFFQQINPASFHPASFIITAYNAMLEDQTSLAGLTLSFGMVLHPDDYLMNWLYARLQADAGDYQTAYDRYEVAARQAPVPFPIARYEQAQLVIDHGDALARPIEACKLLDQAATQAGQDADFYAVLSGQIAAQQAEQGCSSGE